MKIDKSETEMGVQVQTGINDECATMIDDTLGNDHKTLLCKQALITRFKVRTNLAVSRTKERCFRPPSG